MGVPRINSTPMTVEEFYAFTAKRWLSRGIAGGQTWQVGSLRLQCLSRFLSE
jgi:hypothetical protein